MISRIIKITVSLVVLFALAFFVLVFRAGITLRVENHTRTLIENIQIDYEKGTMEISRLKPSANLKKKIGKIGEGANFTVKWNNGDIAKFNVYFDGIFSGYNVVRIVFLPSGQVLLLDNERVYESRSSRGIPQQEKQGAGFFVPGIVNREPTEDERTKGNDIKSETVCKEKNGEWFEKKGFYAYCVLPYSDAGKPCQNSKDCIGHCIAPLTDETPSNGTCQADDSTDDCGRPHYENGKVIYFNCD